MKYLASLQSNRVSQLIPFIPILTGLIGASAAWSEGSLEIGSTQTLRAETILYIDILDKETETISWAGTGTLRILAPNGSDIGTFTPSSTIDLSSYTNGRYRLELSDNQTNWDISVLQGTVLQPGRLWSFNWLLDAGPPTVATDSSYYALVDGGADGIDSVVELKFEGLAGSRYAVTANETGINGNTFNSTPIPGYTFTPTIPLYLNPPAISSYSSVVPDITDFAITKSSPGDYEFSFVANARGICHLLFDANNNGAIFFTPSNVVVSGSCVPGTNTFSWDGTDNDGVPVPEGDYDVAVRLHVGEIHQIADDIETIFPGLRFFKVESTGIRLPLLMYWDDFPLIANVVDFTYSLIGDGVSSGRYVDPTGPSNAHGWGNFTGSSRGDDAFINTISWIADQQSNTLTLMVGPGGPGPSEEPDIFVSPAAISFGDVLIGNNSVSELTIRNEGTVDLTIGLAGDSAGLTSPFSFGIDNCSNSVIAPENSCTIEINFQPITTGAFNDSFNIPSNDPDTPDVTVQLSGSGIQEAGIGGAANGLWIKTVECHNKTTKQKVTISINGGESTWDCESAGLEVNLGDQIDMKVKGFAD